MTQTTTATPHAPAGHHTVTPYVIVSDARAAIAFYTRAFGATQTSLTVDDAGKVRHAEVRIGDSPIMLAENFEFRGDGPHEQHVDAGAREVMPVTDQPYGERSGGVVDPFGHVWWISTYLGGR